MVVQPLCHQLQGQRVLGAARLLDLSPLVLEPNFYLGFVQAQLVGQFLASALCQVPVLVELLLQPGQLLATERGPGPLLLRALVLPLHPPRTGPRRRSVRVPRAVHPGRPHLLVVGLLVAASGRIRSRRFLFVARVVWLVVVLVVPATVCRLAVVAVIAVVIVVVNDGRTCRQRLLDRLSLVGLVRRDSGRRPFGTDSRCFGTGRSGPVQRRRGLLRVWLVLQQSAKVQFG